MSETPKPTEEAAPPEAAPEGASKSTELGTTEGDEALPNFNLISTKAKGEGSQGLFSLRRPRDVGSGLSSGLKNVGKGIASGVASLVGAPIQGARTGGVTGFAKARIACMYVSIYLSHPSLASL